jgi:flagellar motor protein MotB
MSEPARRTAVLLCLSAVGCGPSAEQLHIQSERDELRHEVVEVQQYNADLKFRMKLVEARNKILIDLVQGLTQDPEHFKPEAENASSNADASLKALDSDIEALIASVRHSHTDLDALRAQRAALQTELAQARRTIEEARATHAELDARISGLRKLLNPMLALIHGGRINLSMAYGQVAIQLPEAVLFARGEQRLTAEGKALLAQVAEGLKTSGDRQFRISGPPDVVARRNASAGQQQLSAARALAVLEYLLQCSVPSASLVATTHASAQPSAAGPNAERYIEIALLPKFEERPAIPSPEQLLEPLQTQQTEHEEGAGPPPAPELPPPQ